MDTEEKIDSLENIKKISSYNPEIIFCIGWPDLIKKEILIMKHFERNKKDMHAKRGLILTESKIHRLAKYYKRVGRIPSNWRYDRKQAELLVS